MIMIVKTPGSQMGSPAAAQHDIAIVANISWHDRVLYLRAGTTKMGQGAGGELGEVVIAPQGGWP